jgi:hypothetical protein
MATTSSTSVIESPQPASKRQRGGEALNNHDSSAATKDTASKQIIAGLWTARPRNDDWWSVTTPGSARWRAAQLAELILEREIDEETACAHRAVHLWTIAAVSAKARKKTVVRVMDDAACASYVAADRRAKLDFDAFQRQCNCVTLQAYDAQMHETILGAEQRKHAHDARMHETFQGAEQRKHASGSNIV